MNRQLAEAPCNAASPGGVRMAVWAGACTSSGWEWLCEPRGCWGRGLSGHPTGVLVGECQRRSDLLIPLTSECGDPCLFLSMTCALEYLMGHFKSQGMSLRHIMLQDGCDSLPASSGSLPLALPFPRHKSYNQGARTSPSLPAFPALVS